MQKNYPPKHQNNAALFKGHVVAANNTEDKCRKMATLWLYHKQTEGNHTF